MSHCREENEAPRGLAGGLKHQDLHLEPKSSSWLAQWRGEKPLFVRWELYETSSLLGRYHEGHLPPCLLSAASSRFWTGSTYHVAASLRTLRVHSPLTLPRTDK